VESSAGLIWVKHMGKGSIKLKALGRFLFNLKPMILLEGVLFVGKHGNKMKNKIENFENQKHP
jgi:hypothetical protein